jgi:hypothetical protein
MEREVRMTHRWTNSQKAAVRVTLEVHAFHADRLTFCKDGTVVVAREFFYRFGRSAEQLAGEVKAIFPQCEVVEAHDVWRPFRASGRGSEFEVRFVPWAVEPREGFEPPTETVPFEVAVETGAFADDPCCTADDPCHVHV